MVRTKKMSMPLCEAKGKYLHWSGFGAYTMRILGNCPTVGTDGRGCCRLFPYVAGLKRQTAVMLRCWKMGQGWL